MGDRKVRNPKIYKIYIYVYLYLWLGPATTYNGACARVVASKGSGRWLLATFCDWADGRLALRGLSFAEGLCVCVCAWPLDQTSAQLARLQPAAGVSARARGWMLKGFAIRDVKVVMRASVKYTVAEVIRPLLLRAVALAMVLLLFLLLPRLLVNNFWCFGVVVIL